MQFLTTLTTVALMLAYAIPGFLFVKTKVIKPDSISAFARVLLFVCQPCLILYSLNAATFTLAFLRQLALFFALCSAMEVAVIGAVALFMRKNFDDVRNRICTIACSLANVGFFGVPLLEAILPTHPEVVAFSTVFSVSLNLISWTLAVGIIAHDKSKMSVRNMIVNPTSAALLIALPLFFTATKLPSMIAAPVELLGRMTTPMCMLILGMRLATVTPRDLFLNPRIYLSTAIKNVLYPLLSFAVIFFVPLPSYVKVAFFLLGCCPSASMVLNMSELINEGQTSAACSVLISTIFCIATVPLLSLLLPLFG